MVKQYSGRAKGSQGQEPQAGAADQEQEQ